MQRLVFEPKSGSWILETLENNETVIKDFSELPPTFYPLREPSRSIAKVLISILQNSSCRLKIRLARPDTPGLSSFGERGDRGCGVHHKGETVSPRPYQPPVTLLSLCSFYIVIENLFRARF